MKCTEIVLEDNDIPNALIKYVKANSIEILVLGVPTRGGIFRFKLTDVPSNVIKMTPDFCSVYVITKGKISYMRSSTVAPPPPPPRSNHQMQHHPSKVSEPSDSQSIRTERPNSGGVLRMLYQSGSQHFDEIRSPFTRRRPSMDRSYDLSPDIDISFVSGGRPSVDRMYPSFLDSLDSRRNSRHLISAESENRSSLSSNLASKHLMEITYPKPEFSSSSVNGGNSWLSQINNNNTLEDVELEMRHLRLELKQTMEMYNTACKEALMAKNKENELINRCKMEEGQRLEDLRVAEEATLALVEREKVRCKAAVEAAAASQRLVELEAQKRRNAELKARNEFKERKESYGARSYDVRYRKYTFVEIEVATSNFSQARKIGEGGYGPVYRGELDHTPVAIKVLRSNAAQGRSQFQQEIEVLSCIRHPNMVLLLGACPEFGCLVYEYMGNGSLEDRLFRRGNTPVIPWQLRFRIAAEIATGLLFLHQAKPEPLVHRDLKPSNILLDNNYVSKISDVGLARLLPSSVTDAVTQYHMTSTAGTFCYIDPEYQQTGMLGTKSDIYSLGVLLLQIITAKPPIGLTHHVERALEEGRINEMLDPAVPDWPVGETLKFARLSLQCAEMRKKDRPDLGKVILPELNRLRAIAEDSLQCVMFGGGGSVLSPNPNSNSTSQDVISRPQSGYDSSRSRTSSISSHPGRIR
ncbi:U-box domain-containing protein 35-like [Argentina anserina]|uniref:U-box domain-containing protein 35-like n=1 Tax=Argentina anserina TaxID=57926 RepID=UPI00217671FD|nr:U-box domain-containing protein 35-like [Potentilla anserina]